MDWIEFIRRFMYEGFMGINIWYVIVFVVSIGIIYSNFAVIKFAYGFKGMKRRYASRFTGSVTVKVDLPDKSERLDNRTFNRIKKSLHKGVKDWSSEYDTKVDVGVFKRD